MFSVFLTGVNMVLVWSGYGHGMAEVQQQQEGMPSFQNKQ
jgi:hypothetical protein